jgi:mannose-P-dolichol utilization defect protein 1
VGATIVKVPQIIKILKNKSTYGVSFESVFLEEITQIASVAYNIYRNNPFSIYGETLLITYQMMVIHALFIILDKDNRLKASLLFPPIVSFFLIGYYPEWNLFPS